MSSAPDYLRALAAEGGGSIPVERFMREALYHPQFGYYRRRVKSVGREGDFSTSPALCPAFGEAIARWAAAHRQEVRHSGKWHLVELGGGTGALAAQVLRSLGWWARRGLVYHLVEVSEGLRVAQQKRLARKGDVRWHDDIGPALEAAGGRALIFSNEFVDAFPCAQLVWREQENRWQEVCVGWPGEGIEPVESFGVSSAALSKEEFSALDPAAFGVLRDGQRVELHLAYRQWLARCALSLRAGRLLTIDYGDRMPTLYHRCPRGTLRAYCRHLRFEGLEIYRRLGQQDLTADVNFTDLENWGAQCGFHSAGFESQAAFLRRWLPARRCANSQNDPALSYLLDEAGPGGAFKTLEQTRLL
jgi:SAM-dependent MidA family methyltransferase